MNELKDYLTNSVSSRRGTLVVGQRIASAHHPQPNRKHPSCGFLVQSCSVCLHIRAIVMHISSDCCVTHYSRRGLLTGVLIAKLTFPARLPPKLAPVIALDVSRAEVWHPFMERLHTLELIHENAVSHGRLCIWKSACAALPRHLCGYSSTSLGPLSKISS